MSQASGEAGTDRPVCGLQPASHAIICEQDARHGLLHRARGKKKPKKKGGTRAPTLCKRWHGRMRDSGENQAMAAQARRTCIAYRMHDASSYPRPGRPRVVLGWRDHGQRKATGFLAYRQIRVPILRTFRVRTSVWHPSLPPAPCMACHLLPARCERLASVPGFRSRSPQYHGMGAPLADAI